MRNSRTSKGDLIEVVEAAYDLTPTYDSQAWLANVLQKFRPTLDQGSGVCGFLVEPGRPIQGVAAFGVADGWLEAMGALMTTGAGDSLLYPVLPVATASDAVGRDALANNEVIRTKWKAIDVADGIGVTASDGSGSHVTFVAPTSKMMSLGRASTARFERVAGHVAAGWRLRRAIAETKRDAAVLTVDGKVVHAEGDARDRSARDQLRDAAKKMDRARGQLRRKNDDDALELWRVLVSGAWSLVDRFDTDGRRYIIAHENAPELRDPRGLTPRELQVLTFTGLGHSVKLIAYELGVSISVVSGARRRAMRKLGVRSLSEVAQLFPMAT